MTPRLSVQTKNKTKSTFTAVTCIGHENCWKALRNWYYGGWKQRTNRHCQAWRFSFSKRWVSQRQTPSPISCLQVISPMCSFVKNPNDYKSIKRFTIFSMLTRLWQWKLLLTAEAERFELVRMQNTSFLCNRTGEERRPSVPVEVKVKQRQVEQSGNELVTANSRIPFSVMTRCCWRRNKTTVTS